MKSGLISLQTGQSVPLQNVDISVTINGAIGHVVSVLKYSNNDVEPIETVFTFPLDDLSAVYRFEAEIDEKVIIAECQEKEQARETYNDAMEAGHFALLLEEASEGSDIFRCRVGNLPPQKVATLTICYVTELCSEPGGWLVYTLPTVLRPRYIPQLFQPDTYRDTFQTRSGQQALTMCASPYNMTFKADIHSRRRIREVKTVDEVDIVYSDNMRHAKIVRTWSMGYPKDHDLSFHIAYEDDHQPQAILEHGMSNGTGILKLDALTLSFYPDLGTEMTSSGEYIFVIDRSFSMRGDRIHKAKQTLLLLLKSLPVGCYFNIVSFGSYHSVLFDRGSEAYTENNLVLALQLQETLDASMGGTEILSPLQDIYTKSLIPSHPRQIFLLTDGEVGNTNAVIKLVGENARNTRVFAVGIGEGASTYLVKGVARAGKGKAIFVKDYERLQEKVINLMKCAIQPAIRNVRVEWQQPECMDVINIPEQPPTIYNGEKMMLYALLSGTANVVTFSGKLKLTGAVQERKVEYNLEFSENNDVQSTGSSLPVHRLAAKAQIKELEDKELYTGDAEKTKIVTLSLAANIASRHTSFVGVDKDSKVKLLWKGRPRRADLDKDLQDNRRHHFNMMKSCSQNVGHMHASRDLVQLKCKSDPVVAHGSDIATHESLLTVIDVNSASPYTMHSLPSASSVSHSGKFTYRRYDARPKSRVSRGHSERGVGDDMMDLIALQTFVGSWNLSEELSSILGKTREELTVGSPCEILEFWATCLALIWLSRKHNNRRAEWEIIASKAELWLRQNAGNLNVDIVKEQAERMI